MKLLRLLILSGLVPIVGCNKKEEQPEPVVSNETVQASVAADEADEASPDLATLHSLKLRPITPDRMSDGDPQPLHMRFALEAQLPGELLIRVREPLLAKEPEFKLGEFPGAITEEEGPWSEAAKPVESPGIRQQVLKLSEEEIGTPLALDIRIVHARTPQEAVRVHLTLHRDKATESWLDFYQCRPATRTNRSSSMAMKEEGVLDTGKTALLCSYKFGGDPGEVQVPLTRDEQQWVVLEVGWKSTFDLTP